jgi:hypothetical protein
MRRNPIRQKAPAIRFFVCATLAVTTAQTPIKDISVVYAEGRVTGNQYRNDQYRNDYFGLTLTPVGGKFTEGGFISSQGKRARLIDVEANAKNWEDKYSIAIRADALSANPLIHSPDQYLRGVRHQLEKEGLLTVQEESLSRYRVCDFSRRR